MRKLFCAVLLTLVLLQTCLSLQIFENYSSFKLYQKQYNKRYSCIGEEFYRFMVYIKNLETIERLNKEDEASGVYGLTQFTDMTKSEAFQIMGLAKPKNFKPNFAANYTNDAEFKCRNNLPDVWNWVQEGAVTQVKNQGSCGSCWSFSTAGNIEGQYYFKNQKELVGFSSQQMVDCDVDNFGCNGGWPYNALDFLSLNGGLQTAKTYPLRSNYTGPCIFDPSRAKAKIKGYMNVTQDQNIIKQVLYQKGPLSILLDFEGLMHYKAGVASPRLCGSWPNHALLLVGYGIKDEDYWLIKNSWGPKWGISGYLMLKRGAKKCGIDHWAVTGILQ